MPKRHAIPREGPALRPGLFSAPPPIPRRPGLALAALLLAACAVGPEPGTVGGGVPARATAAREAAEALQAAEAHFEAGRYEEAATRADSLQRAWRGDRALAALADRALLLEARSREASGDLAEARRSLDELLRRVDEGPLRARAVVRLAGILDATGEGAAAVRLLLEEPEAAGERELALMREVALRLPVEELETLAARHPLRGPSSAVVHGELARALALADRLDSARRVARRVAEVAAPETPEADLARALVELEEGRVRRARVGAVLPLTGRFSAIGRFLKEGLELAVEEYRRSAPAGFELELVVEDDGSSAERAVELVERLEAGGALAVLGPVRSEPFAGAARSRRDPGLLLVSPTATEPSRLPGAYTLWAHERREREVGRDVGAWIVGELGLRRTAVLHPATPGGRAAAEGFREGVSERGGTVLAVQGYDPDSTTFATPISAVAARRPDAVFVPAGSGPEVLQIAPQLPYFGLDRSVIAGGSAWSEPGVVRRLDPFAANYRVVGTPVDRTAEGTPWARFRDAYEREYRKSLRDNVLPALGYDALKVILAAIQRARLPLPGSISRAAASLGEVPGATGLLRPDPEGSSVDRRTLIRMLVDGELVPADRAAILDRLERARFRADTVARTRADSVARASGGEGLPRRR